MAIKPTLELLYTNIGRGHPFYLDGVADALIHRGDLGLLRRQLDVFELSHGLARFGWQTARWLYEKGSSGGPLGWIYERVRGGDHNRPGPALRVMGRDIRAQLGASDTPLLVDHPTLVGILRGRPNLLYQHGEVSAPDESLVRGAATVFVPTESVAERFIAAGCPAESVLVSGLCIEPSLVRQAEDAYHNRAARLNTDQPMTGAFFSSGAEPTGHVARLVQAARSLVEAGHTALICAVQGGKLERAAVAAFEANRLVLASDYDSDRSQPESATLVAFRTRRELTALTASIFPQFDFFVASSHERVNWALGLGLPQFLLEPCIGPFAGLNFTLALARGVAQPLAHAGELSHFGDHITRLRREGTLAAMAAAGWGQLPIDGFSRIAEYLVDRYGG